MNLPRYSAAAAKLLARYVVQDAAPAGDRERGIETIERAMRRRSARRRLWSSGSLIAAAAALVLIWRVAASSGPEARLVASARIQVSPVGLGAILRDAAGEHPLGGGAELGPDQAIETADGGGASLRFSTGTRIDLAGASKFSVAGQGRSGRFVLARGELSTKVEKLRPGERFIVETPDAEVEVRGTMFRLAVLSQAEACGAGSLTRLDVREGIVEVRSAGSSVRVGAGEHWPFDCGPRVPAQSTSADPKHAPSEGTDHGSSVRGTSVAPASSARAASSGAAEHLANATALARQNDLFAEAIALRRRGDLHGALHAYQELIRRFPDSPLVENALAERMRLLLPGNPEAAREEARHYVLHYPHGFAATEARRILNPG